MIEKVLNKIESLKIILMNKFNIPVTYDDSFFETEWFDNWDSLKNVLFELIQSNPSWKSVVDFGCGPGIMIDFLNENGIACIGCDYSDEARDLYLQKFGKNPDRYKKKLSELNGQFFDLFVSFDVFEHMSDSEISELFKEMPKVKFLMLNISRAKAIPGHVNLKSDKNWITFIEKFNFNFDFEETKRVRELYLNLRKTGDDLWHKNIFIFRSIDD